MHALRLRARRRIGAFSFAIQHQRVKIAGAGVRNTDFKVFTAARHDGNGDVLARVTLDGRSLTVAVRKEGFRTARVDTPES